MNQIIIGENGYRVEHALLSKLKENPVLQFNYNFIKETDFYHHPVELFAEATNLVAVWYKKGTRDRSVPEYPEIEHGRVNESKAFSMLEDKCRNCRPEECTDGCYQDKVDKEIEFYKTVNRDIDLPF